MPVVGNRKAVGSALFFSLFLLGSMSSVVFSSSGNYVEVARYTSSGPNLVFGEPFIITHQEWRIRWQNNHYFTFGDQSFFYVIRTEDNVPERLNLPNITVASGGYFGSGNLQKTNSTIILDS